MDITFDPYLSPSKTGQDWHHKNCFGCGPENPFSLKADFTFNEENGEVDFNYTIANTYEGAPGYSHGGILASLLDEAQGCLCFYLGHVVMTEKLYLKYHKAVPLNTPISIRAWLTAVRKRRLYTRGMIYKESGSGGATEVFTTSSASWYILPERVQRRMFLNFEEETYKKQSKILELNRKRARDIRLRLRKTK
ncbi:MAG: PaaI family thioesterase [Leptonema sp. (in: bacteria)]